MPRSLSGTACLFRDMTLAGVVLLLPRERRQFLSSVHAQILACIRRRVRPRRSGRPRLIAAGADAPTDFRPDWGPKIALARSIDFLARENRRSTKCLIASFDRTLAVARDFLCP